MPLNEVTARKATLYVFVCVRARARARTKQGVLVCDLCSRHHKYPEKVSDECWSVCTGGVFATLAKTVGAV